ncbi:hypothetical protein EX30DRAFT_248415 [Ascodesmis nigricans]|uniref:Secreted protein n=1 Tax=Ascodesmis nigricans TaxID=341454 RepID=A0A4V6RHA3_9PEZI|nr:hypothetical protein EX30DRAFT_248415 [Ascodesmis nigricans]
MSRTRRLSFFSFWRSRCLVSISAQPFDLVPIEGRNFTEQAKLPAEQPFQSFLNELSVTSLPPWGSTDTRERSFNRVSTF